MYSHNRRGYGSGGGGGSSSVSLPPGMSPGAVIGKGGSNIKLLQSRSGARVVVNSSGRVEVSGSQSAVAEALRLLQLQIRAFEASVGSYPHPLQVHYLLQSCFGDSLGDRLAFSPRSDEVASATGRPEQLYVLAPAAAAAPAGSSATGADSLTAAMTGLSMGTTAASRASGGGGSKLPWVLLPGQEPLLLQNTADAALKAAAHQPGFDEMKLRFNFGKSFFYKGPSSSTSWNIQQLQAKSIPDDLKGVYSNAVTPAAQAALQSCLLQQGFHEVQEKHVASVALHHRGSNAAYSLSFIKNGDGSLTLRKLKSSNTKLAFGCLLCPPDSPDWRFKLLAQSHLQADPALVRQLKDLAAGARLVSSGGSNGSSIAFDHSQLQAADMAVDKERHKDKVILQGRFSSDAQGCAASSIKVTLSKLYDARTRQHSCEVAGCSPELNELLQGLLGQQQHGSAGGGDEQQELAGLLADLVSFAQEAVKQMAA